MMGNKTGESEEEQILKSLLGMEFGCCRQVCKHRGDMIRLDVCGKWELEGKKYCGLLEKP